jgi:hypothetical protein
MHETEKNDESSISCEKSQWEMMPWGFDVHRVVDRARESMGKE